MSKLTNYVEKTALTLLKNEGDNSNVTNFLHSGRKSRNFHTPTPFGKKSTKKYHGTFRNLPSTPPTPLIFEEILKKI